MTDAQRRRLGQRIAGKRLDMFGSKSAAYRAAVLNSGTWDRIEEGLPVRGDRLAAAVKLLWPESRGDWRNIPSEGDEAGDIESVLDKYDIPARARAEILAAARKDPPAPAPRRRKAL
ncbi:MAG: hypothetical protein ACXVXP_08400 [Mycobacteriaceae bacterium]